MGVFKLETDMAPAGDQPEAIRKLLQGIEEGQPYQTLLGVTGSGKTYTMANIIEKLDRPTLVIAHNKTLAGQLCAEFKSFFPNNAVEYFVSYYDYYQPEAYIPSTDTYIEKDSAINEEIDRLRHSATASLLERRDVIVVASVSCIYGLGDPEDFRSLMVSLRPGMKMDRDKLIMALISQQYNRNDFELKRATFRVRGDSLDIIPSEADNVIIRVSFFGDEIEKIYEIDPVTGKKKGTRSYISIFPASHYVTTPEKMTHAVKEIEAELDDRLDELKAQGKLLEAYRLEQRTLYDLDMLKETGFCKGIENYSRLISGRAPGSAPFTLIDFFPKDYLLFIDESHVTVPQIGAMFNGDRSRKTTLVDYGFRLPSAYDNRPLNFTEFESRMGQTIFVSATPSVYEKAHSSQVVEQIIRPTYLLDPQIYIRPVEGQIEDLIDEIKKSLAEGERALVLTLTKKMAEDLSKFLSNEGLQVKYLHSDIETVERMKILRDLRQGKFDVLVGINLLREGLDLPEVSLIAILDADKEGFLRSVTSLVQIIGRASRNLNGRVVMYADNVTDSMTKAVSETNRRREIQQKYNEANDITPSSIRKEIREIIDTFDQIAKEEGQESTLESILKGARISDIPAGKLHKLEIKVEKEMKEAAKRLDFEQAAQLRDLLISLKVK
ncbi:MAG: excinuclease ABC subunit UvrB [Saccharofermentanales bacterium]